MQKLMFLSFTVHFDILRWTKLLPKSGAKFTTVINKIKTTTVPALASSFSGLHQAVLEAQMDAFRRFHLQAFA